MIVRSDGTVTYVGKDIAYQLWKFGLLGRDFDYRHWDAAKLWETTVEGAPEHPAFGPPTGSSTSSTPGRATCRRSSAPASRPRLHGRRPLDPLRLRDGLAVAAPPPGSSASSARRRRERLAGDVGSQGASASRPTTCSTSSRRRAATRSRRAIRELAGDELDRAGAADRHRGAALLHGQGDHDPGHRLRSRRSAVASRARPAPISSTPWCE